MRGAVSRFLAADGFFLGAGLAFCFLICIIPFTLITVATLGFILSSETAARTVVGEVARNFPVYQGDISRVLLRIVETRRVSGVVGTVVLVFFSTPLLSAARLVLHRLLGVTARSHFLRNLLVDTFMVLILSVLLFGATMTTWLFAWLRVLVFQPLGVPALWLERASIGLSLGLSGAMFFLGYRYVPHRRVRAGAAAGGAIVATVLWEGAKQLFGFYIRNIGLYTRIYGPLGVLVAFVMFTYYSAVVFVFGGAYAAALDARRR